MRFNLVLIGLIFTFGIFACAQNNNKETNKKNSEKMEKSKEEWKSILTPIQFNVTQENGTEAPFSGKYDKFYEKGKYHCVCCKQELFESETKFNSGCGWPAFFDIKSIETIKLIKDKSHGMIRTEVRCAQCNAHLGHVFEDGPEPTGLRYCINSAALEFVK